MNPNTLIAYIIVLLVIALGLWTMLVLYYHREKKRHDVSSGLGMALFLVSIPEAQEQQGSHEEQIKTFAAHMEQLLVGLTTIRRKGWQARFWKNPGFALEIATHNTGLEIFFYVAFPRKHAGVLRAQLHGAFPDARVDLVNDYNIFNVDGASAIATFKNTDNAMLPIKTYTTFTADPMETITSAFSKLKEIGEGAALQVMVRLPTADKKANIRTVIKRLKEGKSRKDAFYGGSLSKDLKKIIVGSPKEDENKPKVIDEQVVKLLEEKSQKVLLECNVRVVASAKTPEEADRILRELTASFQQFQNPEGNSLKAVELSGAAFRNGVEQYSFRMFDENNIVLLNTEELASIYHFPMSRKAAPTVRMIRSKEATPPINIPTEGVIIGKSSFRGEEQIIRMAPEDRRRHFYIIGQTGTGKSVQLKNMIAQDIRDGNGVAVIDPHGDVIEYALSVVPKERADDVIHFDPGDTAFPIGLNMLEFDPKYPEYKSLVINELLEIFNKLFNMSVAGGPMFEQYFRNSAALVMEDPESGNTVLDIQRVFADKAFRDYKLSKCKNPVISTFWRQIAEKTTGEQSLSNMTTWVVSKFDVFLSNDIMRPIIMQEKSAFNFREVMDNKKILLLNLAKGKLGETNANLIGMIITGKLLIAALSRTDIPNEKDRKDFFFYIDEFQNVTTKSISTILAEARKYRLNLTVAHQYLGQLEDDIKKAIFGNVGSMLTFRIGAEDAEFVEKQYAPIFSAHDLANIDNLNAYFRPLINGMTTSPFNIKSYPFPPVKGDESLAASIKELSRLKYGRPREEIEAEIHARYQSL
jgi:type IV secretory pathway TraG/TraD family ATPase VirD4